MTIPTPEIERSLKAALLSPDGSPASLREFMASVSTLIFEIGPCHDMPHDDQVQIIAIITTAMRTRLLSACQEGFNRIGDAK